MQAEEGTTDADTPGVSAAPRGVRVRNSHSDKKLNVLLKDKMKLWLIENLINPLIGKGEDIGEVENHSVHIKCLVVELNCKSFMIYIKKIHRRFLFGVRGGAPSFFHQFRLGIASEGLSRTNRKIYAVSKS